MKLIIPIENLRTEYVAEVVPDYETGGMVPQGKRVQNSQKSETYGKVCRIDSFNFAGGEC